MTSHYQIRMRLEDMNTSWSDFKSEYETGVPDIQHAVRVQYLVLVIPRVRGVQGIQRASRNKFPLEGKGAHNPCFTMFFEIVPPICIYAPISLFRSSSRSLSKTHIARVT